MFLNLSDSEFIRFAEQHLQGEWGQEALRRLGELTEIDGHEGTPEQFENPGRLRSTPNEFNQSYRTRSRRSHPLR